MIEVTGMGCLYTSLAVLAVSCLGVTYAVARRLDCDKRQVNFFLFFFAAVVCGIWAMCARISWHSSAVVLGLVMGVTAFLSVAAFREAVARGKLSTSWTILNLSLVIPVVVSIVFWREAPTTRHIVGFILTVVATVMLGMDMSRTRV